MARKRVEEVVEKLVPSPQLKLVGDKGQSLELLVWRGEPSILIDGKTIIRYTTLAQQLSRCCVHHIGEVISDVEP